MMYNVIYEGTDSRYNPGKGVNSMQCIVDGLELYAEADPFEHDETTVERILKAEITRQAIMIGLDPADLDFCFEY